jgi:hypothetical protein
MAVKVKVIADVTVYDGNRTYGLGAVFDYQGGAVGKLVEMGFVEKIGGPDNENSKPPKPEGKK